MKAPLAVYDNLAWLPPAASIEVRQPSKRRESEDTLRQLAVLAFADTPAVVPPGAVNRMKSLLERGRHYIAEQLDPNYPGREVLGMVSVSHLNLGSAWERQRQLKFDALYVAHHLRGTVSLTPEMLVHTALVHTKAEELPVFAEPGVAELERMHGAVQTYSYQPGSIGIVPIASSPSAMQHTLERQYPSVFNTNLSPQL